MKAPVFTSTVAVLTLVTVMFSSASANSNLSNSSEERSAATHAAFDQPGYRRYPLIIVRTPGLAITIGDDGRRCYRNPAGYYYWEGRDGRYYLDERYVRYVDYDRRAYRDWDCDDRHYHKKWRKHHHHDRHDRGRGHGRGHGRDRDRDWDDD